MKAVEVNFDGLIGPTHHYAGLAIGNLASQKNATMISNPKAAALQGLKKMQFLMELNIPQAILPPHERPAIQILRELGFTGKDLNVLNAAYKAAPTLFHAIYSASSMWTANAATVSPSSDSQDGRVHITPANLITHFHRAIEAETTYRILKDIFLDAEYFVVHRPLFPNPYFADEGAANHNRFCSEYGERGVQLFVYGREGGNLQNFTHRYPMRQTLEASQAIARLHQLNGSKVLLVKQNPLVIEEGVFHNDVIATANQNVFFYHESAFENSKALINHLIETVPFPLYLLPVSAGELSVTEAVQSYLFNSQLLTVQPEAMALLAPIECQENKRAHDVLLRILSEDNPIQTLHFADCRQSMLNGGGPACLRLRVVLTKTELAACHKGVFLNEALYQRLVNWVERHYRDRLTVEDLLDPALLEESYIALDELTHILKLGPIYSFQR